MQQCRLQVLRKVKASPLQSADYAAISAYREEGGKGEGSVPPQLNYLPLLYTTTMNLHAHQTY